MTVVSCGVHTCKCRCSFFSDSGMFSSYKKKRHLWGGDYLSCFLRKRIHSKAPVLRQLAGRGDALRLNEYRCMYQDCRIRPTRKHDLILHTDRSGVWEAEPVCRSTPALLRAGGRIWPSPQAGLGFGCPSENLRESPAFPSSLMSIWSKLIRPVVRGGPVLVFPRGEGREMRTL